MRLSPLWLTTGSLGKVAQFRFDNTQVTLRQCRKATEAESLVKAFLGALTTANALDLSAVCEPKSFPQQGIQRQTFVTEREGVRDSLVCRRDHFS